MLPQNEDPMIPETYVLDMADSGGLGSSLSVLLQHLTVGLGVSTMSQAIAMTRYMRVIDTMTIDFIRLLGYPWTPSPYSSQLGRTGPPPHVPIWGASWRLGGDKKAT